MKSFWRSWSSFRTNWLSDAATKHAEDTKKAEADAAEMRRLKLSAPQSPTAPVRFVLETPEPEKQPTRADVTNRHTFY